MADHPVLSILIPNYNNGAASSKDGRRNFIEDLLRSIDETLREDPTPVEILIADDGSTDDSPDTVRDFLARAPATNGTSDDRSGGRRPADEHRTAGIPVHRCRFFPLEHRGIVSRCMNLLLREARGDIFCRFDGDIIIHTPNWASILCEKFKHADPGIGIIGAKQLTLNGRVHSMGDWILHPRGYHHVGQGAERSEFTDDIEVDHVMGCFYACRRAVYEDIGDYDETILRGQTIDWTISARSRGWRVICTPEIEFTHCHSERAWRANQADTPAGLNLSLDRFREKWGFDRLAPNLDDAYAKHERTPLLWNRSVFNDSLTRRTDAPVNIERTDWAQIAREPAFQKDIFRRVQVIMELLADQIGRVDSVAHLACGDGLLTHLLAEQGLNITGLDENPHAIHFARQMCEKAACTHESPRFENSAVAAESKNHRRGFRFVLLSDSIERHPNPVGVFNTAHQLLADNGRMIVLGVERPTPADNGPPGCHRYRAHEINAQIVNTRRYRLHTPAVSRPDGLLLVVAEPIGFGMDHGHFRIEAKGDRAAVPRHIGDSTGCRRE